MSEGRKKKIKKINHMSRTEVVETLRKLDQRNDKLSTYKMCLEQRLLSFG